MRSLAKLFQNSLYGKNCQRPVNTAQQWIKNKDEFATFYKKYSITECKYFEESEQLFLCGYARDELKREENITKPSYLGAFILANSRRIMLEYKVDCNPYFDISHDPSLSQLQKDNDFYYTDTDSIVVHSSALKNIELNDTELGKMSNELGKYPNPKIIEGYFIAPKLYCLGFLTDESHLPPTEKEIEDMKLCKKYFEIKNGLKVYYILKGKGTPITRMKDGVPQWEMTPAAYIKMAKGKTHATQQSLMFKKEGVKGKFVIKQLDSCHTKRVLNKTRWNGRAFFDDDGTSLPFGHAALNQTNLM